MRTGPMHRGPKTKPLKKGGETFSRMPTCPKLRACGKLACLWETFQTPQTRLGGFRKKEFT